MLARPLRRRVRNLRLNLNPHNLEHHHSTSPNAKLFQTESGSIAHGFCEVDAAYISEACEVRQDVAHLLCQALLRGLVPAVAEAREVQAAKV